MGLGILFLLYKWCHLQVSILKLLKNFKKWPYTNFIPLHFCHIYSNRLHGIENAMIKLEPASNETISNHVLLDVVNPKRTNVVISSYSITCYNGDAMHIYCGEDHIFMKSSYIDRRIQLNGIKQVQSDNIIL